LVTANKIVFTSEAFSDINSILARENSELSENTDEFGRFNSETRPVTSVGKNQNGFNKMNKQTDEELRYYQEKMKRFADKSVKGSPGVFPDEFDKTK
jgi:hypothetical protein